MVCVGGLKGMDGRRQVEPSKPQIPIQPTSKNAWVSRGWWRCMRSVLTRVARGKRFFTSSSTLLSPYVGSVAAESTYCVRGSSRTMCCLSALCVCG